MARMVKSKVSRLFSNQSLITRIRLLLPANDPRLKPCATILPESARYFCIQWVHGRPAT